MADVEVLAQLAAGFEPQHGVVVQAVVSEEDDAAGFQHLRGAHTHTHTLLPAELEKLNLKKKKKNLLEYFSSFSPFCTS